MSLSKIALAILNVLLLSAPRASISYAGVRESHGGSFLPKYEATLAVREFQSAMQGVSWKYLNEQYKWTSYNMRPEESLPFAFFLSQQKHLAPADIRVEDELAKRRIGSGEKLSDAESIL